MLHPVLQWTWGFWQNALGGLLTLALWRRPHERFFGAVVTHWRLRGSMSLGMFLFLGRHAQAVADDPAAGDYKRRVLVHEFGHSIQSALLGPLYLPLVGLPSLLWANLPACRRYRRRHAVSYYAAFPENWANRLGRRATALPAPEQNVS
ncbi:MAG: hypothetical protein IJP98_05040 [Clostridia bacterium]|nr:hypothetical protein [Clostridia bacterium]